MTTERPHAPCNQPQCQEAGLELSQRSQLVALLDTRAERRTVLREMLVALGHQPAVFANAADLLIAVCSGHRFDLLLLTLHQDLHHEPSRHESMSEVCKRLCMPTLLVVDNDDWPLLLPRNDAEAAWDDVIDFDALRPRDEELNWRVQTLLHRRSRASSAFRLEGEMTWGDYKFLPDSASAQHRGRDIRLSPLELALALTLFRNLGRVLSRDWIRNALWTNRRRFENLRNVDVCAAKVRKKLNLCDENGFVLRAIREQGYQLVAVSPGTGAPEKLQ